MGDLPWGNRTLFNFPLNALRLHATALGTSGSGKTETLFRVAYGACESYHQQVIYLDAKGESKREDEMGQDTAARFIATMHQAGAKTVLVFPSLHYYGWHGSPSELKNRLLSVIDYSESAFYGDVAANAVDLALSAPTTPRSSAHFLANLNLDRLKAIYANDSIQIRRVLALEKKMLQQVEMRYQVFFSAMAGQLDGTLDYANADAVYLRVRGFTLRNEAPRLGRFLVSDFMHYIAERRRSGLQTLFIIDEFNALRMREETSILFEQVRSFGGNLIISAQGYAGLGPPEYANRILDACSTYILHACTNPGPVSQRAGKKLFFDTTWTEDEEGNQRRSIRPRWDWRVAETDVIQQEAGQAYWIYRGRSQHVHTAMVQLTQEEIRESWKEIRLQEERQQELLAQEAASRGAQGQRRQQASQAEEQAAPPAQKPAEQQQQANQARKQPKNKPEASGPKNAPRQPKSPPTAASPAPQAPQRAEPRSGSNSRPVPPIPDPDDDEPDRL